MTTSPQHASAPSPAARPDRRGGARRTHRNRRTHRTARALLATAALASLTACTGVTYAETPVPTPPAAPSGSAPAPTPPVTCDNPLQTYDPLPSIPARSAITDKTVRTILDHGHLVVGVSADTYLFGSRNPLSGEIEGFDIDIAKAVAGSLLGDPGKIRLRVITAADRIPLLEKRQIDMVARNMTITCDRWQHVAFSAEYYHSGQKVLVAKGNPAKTLEDLKGQRVCAPAGTSSLTNLKKVNGPIPVTAATHTGCLALFQQGKVEAITGDDIVLAGLAAQDPYAVVTSAPAISDEPYGLAFNRADTYLVRYVNRLLADMMTDGRWTAIYDRWLRSVLGKAPAPPKAVYGRS
ncbi:MAG: glutamate ABC transporter substrate-binding protein [Intrasporangium sp.]|uniref:glutamate ABC transporter substrate-binding protein n=1 Tax=Intrasporangium sp. TaxID=1925024 RepID=UPI0026482B8C|nr:glutamate ABC transporter substrate-binding protein [Intrasporangium sp.]MDN5795915.1 glutamate ABC transporter substrate-binding protein [Intrasporangium sp.]